MSNTTAIFHFVRFAVIPPYRWTHIVSKSLKRNIVFSHSKGNTWLGRFIFDLCFTWTWPNLKGIIHKRRPFFSVAGRFNSAITRQMCVLVSQKWAYTQIQIRFTKTRVCRVITEWNSPTALKEVDVIFEWLHFKFDLYVVASCYYCVNFVHRC